MQWNSVSEFFAMGGYAFYVWGSFGATAAVMLLEMLHVRRQRQEMRRSLRNELLSEGASS
ncbi:MAG: heme exporter protein CcmD [Gammaproteobacteria bacterium]|uniref:heme exporter protein CcmD n=1 Tax=Rhodoferax sp. TaxID=50421 RepID=UPI0017E445B2|nr:heme exporter protein CcmD [Rhodoferax sp.]MBU3900822.1 heme exporter protein CcmD [Gammaproteobacteria bacterium]MBA3060025.1 heme exporter protein CcmD [Rhodoferax sp.]MBU3996584.1 heme exporter protein CcmD [Gammaproteobacteria bacterium]MBU4079573.1 heme exporter protein CcmD [Gammaproteobacteria bacterium]MBU4112249.1 heme exporter protein CcmD [Gammaproteobacteria bacterium]